MSKLTEAVAFLAPLGSESDPLHGFFDPERRKAMRTLLDQIENDRRQIAQLNAKHQERDQQFRNLKSRHAYAQAALDEKIKELEEKVADQAAALKMQASAIESISQDRNYWQGEARRLEAELTELRKQTPVGPWMTVASHEAILEARLGEVSNEHRVDSEAEIKNTHRAHVEFHLRAQAEEKLARISEIVGTTDVPEKTIRNYASTGFTAAQLLSELLASKIEAVAGILDED